MKNQRIIPARRAMVIISLIMASLLMVSALSGVSGNVLINDRIVRSQSTSAFKNGVYYDMTDISSRDRWVPPSMTLDANGTGYMMWVDQVDASTGNYTLNYRTTTSNILPSGAWMDWNASKSLKNVNMSTTGAFFCSKGFAIGAPSNGDGKYYAMFSNLTKVNKTKGFDIINVCVWNGIPLSSGGLVKTVATMNITANATWSTIFDNSSLYFKGPCAKILFDANNNMNLAWNNGTALFYKYVPFSSSGKTYNFNYSPEVVDQAKGGSMSEFAMIFNSTGQVHFIYSKGNSSFPKDKELFWAYRLKTTGANNFSSRIQLTMNGREDTFPAATFDANNNLLLTWSQYYRLLPYPCFKIMYMNVNSGMSFPVNNASSIITEISKTYAPQVVAHPSLPGSAFDSSILLLNGTLNFFYTDIMQFVGNGSQVNSTWNFVWQSFANPSDLTVNHTLTVLSVENKVCDNMFHSLCTIGHDIFITFLSKANPDDPLNDPIHVVKVNYIGPTITITAPSDLATMGLTSAAPYQTALPNAFTISFTINEMDTTFLQNSFSWDSTKYTETSSQREATISNITSDALGNHEFKITAVDEVGNTYTLTRYITFTGISIMTIIIIVLVIVIAVAAVAFIFLLYKYKKKIEERQVQLKLGGKAKEKGKEGWGDETEAEEEDKEDREDLDLKEDLKKVDM